MSARPSSSDSDKIAARGGSRKWRRKKTQVANGYRSEGRNLRRIVVGFDDDVFKELRFIAAKHGMAVAAVIRQLVTMGLLDIEDGDRDFISDAPPPKPQVSIPLWVPIALHAEYRDMAELEGEEAAAAYVRTRKRELA